MALQITGKITQITDIETGTGKNGEWSKQNFAIETDGEYPKIVAFTAWKQSLEQLKKFKVADSVTVSFNPESREYQNKFYTDLKACKIE